MSNEDTITRESTVKIVDLMKERVDELHADVHAIIESEKAEA